MFARIWRGIVRTSVIEEYLHYLGERALPAYRAADGCRGVWVLRETQGGLTGIVLLSFWDTRADLEAFADPHLEPETSRGERESLLAFESTAAVFEVMMSDDGSV